MLFKLFGTIANLTNKAVETVEMVAPETALITVPAKAVVETVVETVEDSVPKGRGGE